MGLMIPSDPAADLRRLMPLEHKNRNFGRRLGFALSGLVQCMREEKSFRFQVLAAVAVVIALIFLRPPLIWIALALIVSALVLSAELLNSALERLADELESEDNPSIKAAKDMAAGAVLTLALTAAVIGLLILYVVVTGTG